MFLTSGHIDLSLKRFDRAYVDNENPLVVGSCGQTVKSEGDPRLSICREHGREDYQLIYISKGEYVFYINGKTHIAPEGSAVLYCPNVKQKYYTETPFEVEMFWAHFTGKNAAEILSGLGFIESGIYNVGFNEKFAMLYKWIIKELQLKRDGYIDIANGYFKQILALMSRNLHTLDKKSAETFTAERAMLYFYRNFNEKISIDEYADSLGITPCWFRRCFKNHTGMTPQQFINDIRLSYARELLTTSDHKISDVAARSGYENYYYFSRIFSKYTGCSPVQYRKNNTVK